MNSELHVGQGVGNQDTQGDEILETVSGVIVIVGTESVDGFLSDKMTGHERVLVSKKTNAWTKGQYLGWEHNDQ